MLLVLGLGLSLPLAPLPPAIAQPTAEAPAVAAGVFQADEARKVLSFGLDVIAERHLEAVTVSTLAIEGLRGLRTLDSGLEVALRDRRVELSTPERVVASAPRPEDNDAEGWAQVLVSLTQAGRTASTGLRRADGEAVYQAMFDAMLSHLDPFSRYSGRLEAEEHRSSRNGFGGVGIRYTIEPDRLRITEVLPDTPAHAVGLLAGDSITRIDGDPVADLANARQGVRDRLRGPIDSRLALTIEREGIALEISLRRGLVVPQTVSLENTTDGVAHIRLSSFNQRTTASLADLVEDLRDELHADLRGLVLDLRGNPGGLLDQAVGVADLFLSRGRIVSTRGRHPEAMQSYSAHGGDIADGLPIAVLLDGRSASAAEIVAAALQDDGRAVVVGSTSYGKGTVQTVLRLPNDGEITLTWSRFHTPSGYALHGLGVMPTLCITSPDASAGQVVASLNRDNGGIAATQARWRAAPVNDSAARNELRALCPPTAEADWSVGAEAARSLIADPAAYARALSLATPQSASR